VVTNRSEVPLYASLALSGRPAMGQGRAASHGLALDVTYTGPDGEPLDPALLEQGTDVTVTVALTNTGRRGRYDNVALSIPVPSGWEIHNGRLAGDAEEPGTFRNIRDDRVDFFFGLDEGETRTVRVRINAAYVGTFWMPMIHAEAMYDARIAAREPGRWVRVVAPGER